MQPYNLSEPVIANVVKKNIGVDVPEIIETDKNYLLVKGNGFEVELSRKAGFMTKYQVNGMNFLKEGFMLTPNFWRAATDNDMGAKLPEEYAAWKNPRFELNSLTGELNADSLVVVQAKYNMPEVAGIS